MPFIPVPGCGQVRVIGSFAAGPGWENVYHYRRAGVPLTQGEADSVAGIIHDNYIDTAMDAQLSTQWSIDSCVVTDLSTEASPQFTSVAANTVGLDASEVLPITTCGMIDWRTALRGRGFRGRTFLNGWCEDNSTGHPIPGAIALIQAFADGLLLEFNGLGANMVIVSKFLGKHDNPNPLSNRRFLPTPRVGGGIMTNIVSGTAETVWKLQRRRALAG